MLLSMSGESPVSQPPVPREPSLRSREYVSFRAEQLLEENQRLNLPSMGGFVQSFVNLEAGADRESQLWGARAGRYSGLYVLLGLPAAVLAAVAGVTVLASTAGRVVAGIIALASAALSAGATFLDSAKKRDQAAKLNADWEDLYNEMRVCRLTRLASFTTSDGPPALTSFAARAAAIRAGRDAAHSQSGSPRSEDSAPLFFRVPNMVGVPLAEAEGPMSSGLTIEVKILEGYLPRGLGDTPPRKPAIVDQSIRAGTPVPEGTRVVVSAMQPPPMT